MIFSEVNNTIFFPVGRPINVMRRMRVSKTDVDHLHEVYVNRLKELFDKHKATCSNYPDAELEVI